jgi:hypothetical protein
MRKVTFYRVRMSLLLAVLLGCIGVSLALIFRGFLTEDCSVNDVFGAAIATIFMLLFVCILPAAYRYFRNGFSKKPAIVSLLKEAKEIRAEYRINRRAEKASSIIEEGNSQLALS